MRDDIKAIDAKDIGAVNTRLADAKLDIKAIERSYDIREENGRRTATPRENPILTGMDDPAGELTGSAPGWSSSTRNMPGTPQRRAG